jgi:ectoine hydroxylase-related dioxygenase (phytanoyl-CoA dioxygenase family)
MPSARLFHPHPIKPLPTPMPLAKILQELDYAYPLSRAQIAQFREQGFIKLKNVLSPETLTYYGREITAQVLRLNVQNKPMSERTTYERAFLQIMNLWRQSAKIKEFCFSKRLARIAAELMGVAGVRLYHDQALYKEPGGGITPWHADQFYWPLSNDNSCTVWIPLQETPLALGPLAFSRGSHKLDLGRDLAISDESEAQIQAELSAHNLPLIEEPFELGEVSYHYGWTFHRAGENKSTTPRAVMTIIYMEDGIRLTQPKNANQIADWKTWMPGARVGEVVDTPLNPVLYGGGPGA